MWCFSYTVVSCNFNTKSGHLFFTGLTKIHVGSVVISHTEVFELWVEDSFDNTAPSSSQQNIPPSEQSMQFRKSQTMR